MSEGRTRLGSRLALESLVIVASILLAFAVDASWDRYRDRQRAAAYLEALESEFVEARAEMERQIEEHGQQLAAIHHLLDALAAGERSDQLWDWVRQLRYVYVYGPSHPVFEDLAGSGNIELLGSPELRFALLRYGQAKDFLHVLSNRELRLWEDHMYPYLATHTDGLRHAFPDEARDHAPRFPSGAEALYTDRTFQNLLLRRAGSVAGQLEQDEEVLVAVEDVLREIGRER